MTVNLGDLSRYWYDATSDLEDKLRVERSPVAEQITVLSEIAVAIKREAENDDLDPHWTDFVAKVSAIDFSVDPDDLDKVAVLQGECELAAAAMLEDDCLP
jgi:hypothetical protein